MSALNGARQVPTSDSTGQNADETIESNSKSQPGDEVHKTFDGYRLFAESNDETNERLKTANGQTFLLPQPTIDRNDPLNWSSAKKGLTLAVIVYIALLAGFSCSISTVTQTPGAQRRLHEPKVIHHSQAGNFFALGVAGPIIVVLSNYFGRLPILLLCMLGSIGTAAWSATATSSDSFFWARIVHGLFSGIGQSTGLMQIQDMYFLHEHPTKINIWTGAFTAGPFVSPLVFVFVVFYKGWEWCYWVTVITFGVALVLVVLFVDETSYNRRLSTKVPRDSRLLRLIGVEQWTTGSVGNSLWDASSNAMLAITKLPILLVVIFLFLNYAWFVGVTIIIVQSLVYWTLGFFGLFHFAPLIGVAIGGVTGHWAHDIVGRAFIRRHNGILHAETRLVMVWPAGALLFVSVLLVGVSYEHIWPWQACAVLYAVQAAGMVIATTAISAYLLDAYPEAPGEVAAWLNVGRYLGGFMATFVISDWVDLAGGDLAYGVQAAISAVSMLIILLLQIFGRRLRKWQGPIARTAA